MTNNNYLTVRETAELANVSRQNLYLLITKGKISCQKDSISGQKRIEVSEICRAFPHVTQEEIKNCLNKTDRFAKKTIYPKDGDSEEQSKDRQGVSELEQKIKFLIGQVTDAQAKSNDYFERWTEERERVDELEEQMKDLRKQNAVLQSERHDEVMSISDTFKSAIRALEHARPE